MEPQENEFREEPSWFEEGTFTVIINTANPRWKTRFTPDQGVTSRALNYMAELYIWEISKMAFKKEPDKIGWKFINLKNKYFEEQNGPKSAA